MRSLHFETRDGGVLLLTISRPQANSFDLELRQELSAAVREAARSPATRALVLTGDGEFFSAGVDLRAMAAARVRAYAQATAQLLAPRVNRVMEETDEQRRRVDAIIESEESAAAMAAHVQRLLAQS